MDERERIDQLIQVIDESRLSIDDKKALVSYLNDSISIDRDRQAAITKATLKVGDEVMLEGLKPSSLNGMVVTVEKINRNRIVAVIPGKGRVTIPMSCVSKV